MILKITPFDTVFFGAGKPFVRGEDSAGVGMFPPLPSVFYGAFRSLYFSNDIDSLQYANVDEHDPTKDFRIDYYGLIDNQDSLLFPTPMDLIAVKSKEDEQKNKLHQLKPKQNDLLSSYQLPYMLCSDIEGEPPLNSYIIAEELKNYLDGNEDLLYKRNLDEYLTKEVKTGIYRDRETKSTSKKHDLDANNNSTEIGEGGLYTKTFLRMENKHGNSISFVIDLHTGDKKLEDKGIIRLGSHNKASKYENISIADELSLGALPNSKYFKLYIATPTIFKNGWYPSFLQESAMSELTGEINGCKVKLIAAAVPGYMCCGGYDIKTRTSKDMKRAVPPASVYYFELTDDSEENRTKIFNELNGKFISDEKRKEGFGLVYIGRLKL